MNQLRGSTGSQSARSTVRWGLLSVLVVVFFFAQPYSLLFSVTAADTATSSFDDNVKLMTDGQIGRQLAVSVLAAFGVFAWVRQKRTGLTLANPLFYVIALFLGWAISSVGWSAEPLLTVRKLVVLLALSLGSLGVAKYLRAGEVVWFVFASSLATLFLALACELALGTFNLFDASYRLSGVMHPNFLAWNIGMLIITGGSLYRTCPRTHHRAAFALVISLTIVCLFLTKSRGGVAGVAGGLVTYCSLVWSNRWKASAVLLVGSLLCILGLLVGNELSRTAVGMATLGRSDLAASDSEETMSGRLPYWRDTLLPLLMERPVTGYGYGSFFSTRRLATLAALDGWYFPDAHNSFIEIALGLGLVGMSAYVAIVILGFRRAAQYYSRSGQSEYAAFAAIIVCSLLNSFVSSAQLHPYLGSFYYLAVIGHLAFVKCK